MQGVCGNCLHVEVWWPGLAAVIKEPDEPDDPETYTTECPKCGGLIIKE